MKKVLKVKNVSNPDSSYAEVLSSAQTNRGAYFSLTFV